MRERGADVHFKRVETPEQADAAIAAGATLVQGFFYDRPQRAPLQAGLAARPAQIEA